MTRPVSPSAHDSVAGGSALRSKSTLLTWESDACQGTAGGRSSKRARRGELAMNRSPIPSVPSHTFSLSSLAPFLPSSSFVVVTPPTSYKLYVASQPAKTFNVSATPTRRHLDPDAICGEWSAPLLPLHVFVESTNSSSHLSSSSSPPPFSFSFYTS